MPPQCEQITGKRTFAMQIRVGHVQRMRHAGDREQLQSIAALHRLQRVRRVEQLADAPADRYFAGFGARGFFGVTGGFGGGGAGSACWYSAIIFCCSGCGAYA